MESFRLRISVNTISSVCLLFNNYSQLNGKSKRILTNFLRWSAEEGFMFSAKG